MYVCTVLSWFDDWHASRLTLFHSMRNAQADFVLVSVLVRQLACVVHQFVLFAALDFVCRCR